MMMLKSITPNGICFIPCRNLVFLMKKCVLLLAIFMCKQNVYLSFWGLVMLCAVTGTVFALVQTITVARIQSQVAELLYWLVALSFPFQPLPRFRIKMLYIYIYTYYSSENVFEWVKKVKKTQLIQYVLSSSYSIAGIWDVAILLPGFAADWLQSRTAGPLRVRDMTHIIPSLKALK